MDTSRLVFDEKERVGDWVAAQVGQNASWGDHYAMGAEKDGELVAGIVFNNMTDSSATCHIAVSRVTKLFSALLDFGADYAFRRCGLLRLTGLVAADNPKALKLDKHIGFVEEGVMCKAANGGVDLIVLVLWPENFRGGKLNGR